MRKKLILSLALAVLLLNICGCAKPAATLPEEEEHVEESLPLAGDSREESPAEENASEEETPSEQPQERAEDSASALPPEAASTPETPSVPEESLPPEAPALPEPEPAPGESGAPVDPPAGETGDRVYHEKVPILMYHEVNDLLANSLYLSVKDFTAHLDYLEQAGITPISMQQLYDHWSNEEPLPEKPIVLTFDDGYRSMYTTVYPLLKERGWSGTFFCITSTRQNEGHISDDMIAEMAANGMEIGSHTVGHVELNSRTGEKLLRELSDSKDVLAAITGKEINMLCYPVGRYNEETKTTAGDVGYVCAVTTQYGFAAESQGLFELKRIRVSQGNGANWLKNVLAPLGY